MVYALPRVKEKEKREITVIYLYEILRYEELSITILNF